MTDTFANGPLPPGGATQQAGDVTGTLAELERKLRELEHELSSIGRRRMLTDVPAGDTATGSPEQTSGRLVDEAIEPSVPLIPVASAVPAEPVAPTAPAISAAPTSAAPVAPAEPAAPSAPTAPVPTSAAPSAPTAPATSAAPTSAAPVAPAAPGTPLAPPTPAATAEPAGTTGQPVKFMRPLESARPPASRAPARQSEKTRIGGEPRGESEPQWELAQQERLRPTEAQLASLAELRRFRDRLERFARDLAAEYDALLGRVMSGLTSASPPASTTTSAHTPPGSAPPALAPTDPAAAPAPPAASPPATAPAPPAAGPPATAPAAPAPSAARESPEDTLFEGRVELGVGPFYDIASLSAFERRLASLPHVGEASVRRFEASHAVVDLRLSAPVALVRELRRTAETDFSVREVAAGRILLTFDEP
jgi:hypothetical protein